MTAETREPSAPSLVRVAILGHQRVMLAGLSLLLNDVPGFHVVDQVEIFPPEHDDRKRTVRPASEQCVDLFIVDIDGEDSDPLRGLSSIPPAARFMLLASSFNQATLVAAFKRGATGAVLKRESKQVLVEAVRSVSEGKIWLDRSGMTDLVTGLSGATNGRESERANSLTPREKEVVALIGQGLRNLEIGDILGVSEVTVRNHLSAIFRKLCVPTRFKLALYAFSHGLSTPETSWSFRPSTQTGPSKEHAS